MIEAKYNLSNRFKKTLAIVSDFHNLENIVIPEKYKGRAVTSIDNSAFYGCSNLTSVTIGNSVTSIGDWAFSGCSSLTSVEYEGTKEDWNKITKASGWNEEISAKKVVCSDGDINF